MTDFALATVKAVADETDDGPGRFEAILSTSALDRDGEIIDAKAFDPLPESIPIYFEHDWKSGAKPIGRGTPYYEGDVVKIDGTFASTKAAQEIRTLVTEGVVDSMSVGFLNGKRTTKSGVRHVISGEVFEGSLTAIPINTTAKMIAAKALGLTDASLRQERAVKAIEGSYEALRERLCDALEDAYGEYCCWVRGVFADVVIFDCGSDTFRQAYTDDGAVATLTGTRSEVEIHEVVAPNADAAAEPPEVSKSLPHSEGAADPAATAAGSAVTDEAEQNQGARIRLLTQLGTA